MKRASYRLGEHKIIETNGVFWWEAHAGVGGLKSGRCFIRGDILFIGLSESEDPGYLKREFLERLQELPQWCHTRYFSLNYTMHDIESGKRLTEEEIPEWAGNRSQAIDHTGPEDRTLVDGAESASEMSYKMGQHEIIKKTNGQVWWKTYSGSGSLREGRCLVAGEILFLGAGETEEPGNLKRSFLERLQRLPQWRATRLYCPGCAVYDCRTGKNLIGEEGGQLSGKAPRIFAGDVFTPSTSETASSTPLPIHQQTLLDNSSRSFLRQIARKVGRRFEGRFLWTGKSKRVQKNKGIESRPEARNRPVHRFSTQRWIAWICASILIVGSRLLILLHDQWKSWERRLRNHDHSDSHHRRH
jgi:hypothetical protein